MKLFNTRGSKGFKIFASADKGTDALESFNSFKTKHIFIMKNSVSIKWTLGCMLLVNILGCQKEGLPDIAIKNMTSTTDTSTTVVTPPVKPPVVVSPPAPTNVATYFWDNVGTFPSGNIKGIDPILPNTQGSGSGQPTGCKGWALNSAYSNNINSISNTIERTPGHPSLHLICNPVTPAVPTYYDSQIGGNLAANYRSEVYLTPWHFHYSVPGELWLSWSYYFPSMDAVFDSYHNTTTKDAAEGSLHQLHSGQGHPPIEIWQNASAGNRLLLRIYSGDAAKPTEYYNTSVNYPVVAGKWMDFIEHVQWATDNTGLYELWCVTGGVTTKVFTYKGPNTFTNPSDGAAAPYGGTPKFGIYHYYWHTTSTDPANNSKSDGTTQLETYLGPVRMIYNNPGSYDANGFNLVNPANN